MYQSAAFRFMTVAAVASFVAACGTPDIATVASAPTAKKTSKMLKNPAVRVIDADTVVSVPADSATVNLEFSLRDEGAATRTLMDVGAGAATIAANIHHVDFTVTGPALAQPLTATVQRAQFLEGKAVIQFNNLPPGSITITAVAKDAAGNAVVSANGSGEIRVGELTKVKLTCVVPPSTGVGHLRIEMDCFSGDCLPQPVATPTSFVPVAVNDVTFSSTGDPHEDGANGLKFDNKLSGKFLAIKTLTNDFAIVKSQAPEPTGRWPGATVNNAIAIQANGDVFSWYLYGRRIIMNGATVPATVGMVIQGRKGTKVTFQKLDPEFAVADVETPQGDKVRIEDRKFYLNLKGTIGGNRVVHEVHGAFGTFNNGTDKEGMLLRSGVKAANLNAFLEDWRVKADEDLFANGPVIVPTGVAGGNQIEVN